MKTVVIIGQKGKIGQRVKRSLPAGFTLIEESSFQTIQKVDYIILASSKEKAQVYIDSYKDVKDTKLIDFTGALKPLAFDSATVSYGMPSFYRKHTHVSMPGCSAYGMLLALLPLKDIIKSSIFVDVKFSKSAVQYDSPAQSIKQSVKGVYPLDHHHQREVEKVLGKEVMMASSIVDIPSGLSLNIFLDNTTENVKEILSAYYEKNTLVKVVDESPDLALVINSSDVKIFVKQKEHKVLITVILDNLGLPFGLYL